MNTRHGIGLRHHGGNQTPTYAEADPLSTTCMRIWSLPRSAVAARSPQRSSNAANRSWPKSAPISCRAARIQRRNRPRPPTRALPTESRVITTGQQSQRRFCPTACGRNFPPTSANTYGANTSGPRPTSQAPAEAHHYRSSRTTSKTRSAPPKSGADASRRHRQPGCDSSRPSTTGVPRKISN